MVPFLSWPLLAWLTLLSARYPQSWWPLALLWSGLMGWSWKTRRSDWRKALLACPLTALLSLGPLRPWLLYQFKLGQIERGRLSYYAGWGWVDERHRLPDVVEALTRPGPKSFVHTSFGDALRLYELEITSPELTPVQAWCVLKNIAERGEAWESSLPWWTGAGWSAFEADDLPSSYLEIYQQAHPDFHPPRLSAAESCQRWRQEGMQLLQRQVSNDREFLPADPALERPYRELMAQLQHLPTACLITPRIRWRF